MVSFHPLFLLYINITTILPRHVSNTLHADDLAVWSAADPLHLQPTGFKKLSQEYSSGQIDEWSLQISKIKPKATVFSLATLKEKITLKLGDRTLPQEEIPIFLRVKLDPQIDEMATKGIRKLALLKNLAGTHWGANSKIIKTVYT